MAEGLNKEDFEDIQLSGASEGKFVGDLPAFDENESLVGKVIENRYEIQSLIGQGGIGNVYKANHVHLKKTIAIKFLAPHLVGNKRALERFNKEAHITCNLSHPNIVNVREYGITQGRPFLVMDYVEGRSLKDHIEANLDSDLDEKKAIRWFLPILEAIQYAHDKGIVHRDIKPANIIVESDEPDSNLKILDFGIAKMIEFDTSTNNGITRTGEWFGTPSYMSPEQCHGEDITSASDIYSIGCVLFEIFEGCPPFTGKSALEIFVKHNSEKAPSIKSKKASNSIKTIIGKCLEKEKEDRYQTARELKSDLEAVLNDSPISAKKKRKKRISKKNMLISVLVLTVTLGTAYALVDKEMLAYLGKDENSWEVLEQKGLKLRKKGKRKEGAELIERAYDIAKEEKLDANIRLRMLNEIASAYRGIPNFEKYKNFMREYINLAFQVDEIKKGETALFQISHIEFDAGEYDASIKDLKILERSLLASRGKFAPGLLTLYSTLGQCYYKQGETELAEATFLKCVEKYNRIHIRGYEASVGFAYYYLAKIYESNGDLDKKRKYTKLAKDNQSEILDSKRKTHVLEKRFLNLEIK